MNREPTVRKIRLALDQGLVEVAEPLIDTLTDCQWFYERNDHDLNHPYYFTYTQLEEDDYNTASFLAQMFCHKEETVDNSKLMWCLWCNSYLMERRDNFVYGWRMLPFEDPGIDRAVYNKMIRL